MLTSAKNVCQQNIDDVISHSPVRSKVSARAFEKNVRKWRHRIEKFWPLCWLESTYNKGKWVGLMNSKIRVRIYCRDYCFIHYCRLLKIVKKIDFGFWNVKKNFLVWRIVTDSLAPWSRLWLVFWRRRERVFAGDVEILSLPFGKLRD